MIAALDGFEEHRTARLLAVGAMLFMLCVPVASGAQQQDDEKPLGELETQETASMNEATFKQFAKAQEAAEAENYAEAIRILDKLSEDGLNSYEQAQALNLYAYIYYAQDDYPKSIRAYERMLQQPDLPQALEMPTVSTLSQLYFATENWRKAIEMTNRWLDLGGDPQPQTYEFLAQAYYQLGEYRNALQPAQKAVDLTRASGTPVKENTYLLIRLLYYELGEYRQVAVVLQELISRYPKKEYWFALANIYGELGDEKRQVGTMELLYLQGYLQKEPEVMNLVGLLLQNDLPYKAGKILQQGLDDGTISSTLANWRLLAQAWTLAQEDDKAVPSLIKAAGLSGDGELDIVLAQTYINLGRWEEAVAAARKAIQKGGLDRPDHAQVMIGQSLFELDRFDEARTAFRAAQADRRSRQLAAQWLNYIDSEEDRLEQIAAALE